MRFLLATALLASVLALSAFARVGRGATSAPDEGGAVMVVSSELRRFVPSGRCLEAPISLALAVTESQASHGLSPGSLVSGDGPATALPSAPTGHVQAPLTPPPPRPRACDSPDEPGCQCQAPVSTPGRIQLSHADHGAALFALPTWPVFPPRGVPVPPVFVTGGPRAPHALPLWRPPRTASASG